MNYHNTYPATDEKTFFVLVCTRVGRYIDRGYKTLDEAAWQADRAKFVLNSHGLIGRLSAYNFPERLAVESESSWSLLPPALTEFLCNNINTAKPISEDEAAFIEEAKRISEINIERQRLLDEETKKLHDAKTEKHKATLTALVKAQTDVLQVFDTLHLPKSIKERNAIAHALGLLCSRLAQL